jgi:hypothetical protein
LCDRLDAAELLSRGKPKGVVRCALGHRANRAAFAMMCDQRPSIRPAGEEGGDGPLAGMDPDQTDVSRPHR